MKAVLGADPRPNCLIIDEIDGAPQVFVLSFCPSVCPSICLSVCVTSVLSFSYTSHSYAPKDFAGKNVIFHSSENADFIKNFVKNA